MKKICLFTILLLATIGNIYAEECNCIYSKAGGGGSGEQRHSHMFTVAPRIGLTGLTYKSDYGKMKPNINTGIEATYASIWNGIGFRLGLGVSYSRSQFEIDNYADSYMTTDQDGDNILVSYEIDKVVENHRQWYIEIPFLLSLDFVHVQVNVGPKMLTNLSAKYTQEQEFANLHVENKNLQNDPNDNIKFYKAGNYAYNAYNGKITQFPFAWIALTGDILYKLPLKSQNILAFGAYFDISLSKCNVRQTGNLSLLTLNTKTIPFERQAESILSTNIAEHNHQLVSEYRYFTVGIKLSYNIIFEKKKQ